jgi:hypothetical protein
MINVSAMFGRRAMWVDEEKFLLGIIPKTQDRLLNLIDRRQPTEPRLLPLKGPIQTVSQFIA